MAFYTPRNIGPADQVLFDADGNAVGIQAAGSSSQPVLGFNPTKHAAIDSLVSGGGIPGLKKRNAAMRLGGLSVSTVSTTDVTRGAKVEAEAPFSRVRLRLYSEGGAATAFRIAVGATETLASDNANNLSEIVVGGTVYNGLRASDGAPGWVLATVGGASTFDWAGSGSADNPKELVTDWVDVRSVARADGGTRPVLSFRVQHAGSTAGDWAGFSVSTWLSGAGAYPWFRAFLPYSVTGTGVTDLTLTTASVATTVVWCAVEFDYDVPAYTVLGIGDSHFEQHGGSAIGVHGNWLFQACANTSSVTRPIHYFNAGRSGGGVADFTPNGLAEIARLAPKIVCYEPITSNDGVPTDASVRAAFSRIAKVFAACQAVSAKLVLVTGIPFTSSQTATEAADALRLSITTHCAELAAAGLVSHVDFEDLLGTGAVPNRIQAALLADAVHFNQTAAELLAARMGAKLNVLAA